LGLITAISLSSMEPLQSQDINHILSILTIINSSLMKFKVYPVNKPPACIGDGDKIPFGANMWLKPCVSLPVGKLKTF
jgi:hypothetical protein